MFKNNDYKVDFVCIDFGSSHITISYLEFNEIKTKNILFDKNDENSSILDFYINHFNFIYTHLVLEGENIQPKEFIEYFLKPDLKLCGFVRDFFSLKSKIKK
jgi:hypothetical protein